MRRLWLRVGAALERGAVVVAGAVGIVARRLLLGLLGLGAQGGLVLGVGDLAGEHDIAEAGLHGVKFRSRDDVFLASWENAGNFFLRVLDALGRGRVRRKNLGNGAGTALLIGLDAFEESHIGVRIVTGFIHVLDAEEIRLAFGVARKLEQSQGKCKIQAWIHGVPGHA